MDHRAPLKLHTVLDFEGMACHIEEVVGWGNNAIVYKGWYQDQLNRDQRHHVLVKELFPFHSQEKIYRAEDGRLIVEPEAEAFWKDHKESFEVGNKVHLRLLYDHPELMVMGANLNSFQFNGTLYSVLGYTGGRSLQAELNKNNVSLRHTAQRMIGLLDALEAFHKSGYLHLDIKPNNIMLVGQEDQERIFLIDYNSAWELGNRDSSYLSCKDGYSAPEVINGNINMMGFASDLYSVAAVFFRCIMGRKLTLPEVVQSEPPEPQDSPMLKDMPQTVVAQVSAILKKGLRSVAKRRYQSIGQMRQAFQELLDRIDCIGVTHWALWESGKRSVEELIRINPALRYLKDEKKLYPIRLEQEYSMSLERYLDNILSPEGVSGLILAQGGMGKTTLLLHTAMLKGKRYSAATPAVFYISLNGWDKADTRYIRSQILMRLRFKKEENTFDSAMHALHKLLEQPIRTKQGEMPKVLLLLDGLNEVQGDMTPLVQEINELNDLAGVRMLATSRSEIPELKLETVRLMPLDVEDIEEALSRKGLLIPQKQDVTQLLRTPLILSIYIQASEGGKQLDVSSEEELMNAYMDSLLEKEIRQLPEESPLRWQIDVALNYVLPAIAAEARKCGSALTERQMLKVVEGCWKMLRSKYTQNAFPERWVGRTKEIFWNAKNPDEWYGIIIYDLLWQRMGLLIKDSNKQYRVFHQQIEQNLESSYLNIARKILRKKRKLWLCMGSLYMLFLLCIGAFAAWEEFESDLRFDVWYPCSKYYDHYDAVVQIDFDTVQEVGQLYIQDPDIQTAKPLSAELRNAALDISDSLKWWTFYSKSSERFNEETGMMQYADLDEEILKLTKKSADNLIYLDKSYLASFILKTDDSNLFTDYCDLLITLDTMLGYHQNNSDYLPEIGEYMSAMFEFVQKRGELSELLYHYYYYYYNSEVTDSQLHDMDMQLTKLAERLAEIYTSLPQDIQRSNEERLSIFRENGVWKNFGDIEYTLLPVPEGWEIPDWFSEEAETVYLASDPASGKILEITGKSDVIPFAWHAICYDVSREDVMQYVEAVIQHSGPYMYRNNESDFQATIQLEKVSVTIIWTEERTELFITGAIY